MSNQKNENTKQINNTKEGEITKIADQKQQEQQINDTVNFTISDTTTNHKTESNNINDEYQKPNKAIIDNNIETVNKYQEQQTVNSNQSSWDNSINLQHNIFTTLQSAYSKFINEVLFKSYWNNYLFPTAYLKLYSNTNEIIINNTINTTRVLNDLLELHIETFNKSIEIAQKYYKDGIRNYFNL